MKTPLFSHSFVFNIPLILSLTSSVLFYFYKQLPAMVEKYIVWNTSLQKVTS